MPGKIELIREIEDLCEIKLMLQELINTAKWDKTSQRNKTCVKTVNLMHK